MQFESARLTLRIAPRIRTVLLLDAASTRLEERENRNGKERKRAGKKYERTIRKKLRKVNRRKCVPLKIEATMKFRSMADLLINEAARKRNLGEFASLYFCLFVERD